MLYFFVPSGIGYLTSAPTGLRTYIMAAAAFYLGRPISMPLDIVDI